MPSLRWIAPALAATIAAAVANAQVVRGSTTERATSLAVPGVLLTLENAGSSTGTAISTLSMFDGAYALSAPGPGRYRLVAKRIGVRRFTSDPFVLAAGETKVVNVALDALSQLLPEVFVSGLCVNRRNDLNRVASLWDEIRTALLATQVSLRDRLVDASVLQYYSIRTARDLGVLFEHQFISNGLLAPPFASISADTLSKRGYWHRVSADSAAYHGPDAEVLASQTFLRDHCFALIAERQGLIGLAFQPARTRQQADVRGTIWIDARSYRLQRVEFGYTRLPNLRYVDQVRGEVHFAVLPNGTWIVQRWFIRTPYRARWAPRLLGGDAIRQLREEGGFVQVGASSDAPSATLEGILLDSAGRRLPGAAIRIAGTVFGARTDDSGRFRIDGLPARREAVVAQVDGYDRFDLLAADAQVSLVAGQASQVTLRAHNTATVADRLCDGRPLRQGEAVLLVSMIDSATATPMFNVGFRMLWTVNRVPVSVIQRTNSQGSAVFCGLPSNAPLELSLVVSTTSAQVLELVSFHPGEVASKVFSGRRLRGP